MPDSHHAPDEARKPPAGSGLPAHTVRANAENRSVLPRIEQRLGQRVRVELAGDEGRAGDGAHGGAAGAASPAPTPADASLLEGKYRLHGELGRGGVGVVLRGSDLDLGRDVAIKVLLEEHQDRPDVLKRFVEEAQIGGQLQHPGVVPVYDLGLVEGRPFFAMKLIRGESLEAMLEKRADPREGRRRFLGVFEQVCHTLAYAHARGVIHRDLKPGNVMVGAFGEVQVVDWGMGKVLGRAEEAIADGAPSAGAAAAAPAPGAEPRVETVRTGSADARSELGSMMGTPGYMPPEQVRGALSEIDERSDVFALGAILFEILTGEPPQVGDPLERVRMALVCDPEGIAMRLDASGADPELADLARRCLAKDRDTRPRSAREVAERTAAYLSGVEERAQRARLEAAEARTETAEAQAREAASRERAAREEARAERQRAEIEQAHLRAQSERRRRIAAVLVGAALVVGVVGTSIGMVKAEDQRKVAVAAQQAATERAEGERKANETATKRLAQVQRSNEALGSIFEGLDPFEATQAGIPMQALLAKRLDGAAAALEGDSLGDPLEVARMQATLGRSLFVLGEPERGAALFEKVRAYADAHLDPEDPLASTARVGLAAMYGGAEDWDRALPLARDVLERAKKSADPKRIARATANLGGMLRNAKRLEEAEPTLLEALSALRAALGPDDLETALCLNNLATVYVDTSRIEQAVPLFEEARRITEAGFGPDHPKSILCAANLVQAYLDARRVDEALAIAEPAYERARTTFGADMPITMQARHALTSALRAARRTDAALDLIEQERKLAESRYGPGDARTLEAAQNVAAAYWAAGRFAEAITRFEDVLKRREAVFGREDPLTQGAVMNLGAGLMDAGREEEALPLLLESLAHAEANSALYEAGERVYRIRAKKGDVAGGIRVLEETLARCRASTGERSLATRGRLHGLGVAYYHTRRVEKSLPVFEELLALDEATVGPSHSDTVLTLCNLAANYAAAGRRDEAKRAHERALVEYHAKPAQVGYGTTEALHLLSDACAALGRYEEQIALLDRNLASAVARAGRERPDDESVIDATNRLAVASWRARRFDRSVPLFEGLLATEEKAWGKDDVRTIRTMANLGVNYLDAGRAADAAPLLDAASRARGKDPSLLGMLPKLAEAYIQTGEGKKAVRTLKELLFEIGPRMPKNGLPHAGFLAHLARAHWVAAEYADAERVGREALAIRERVDPDGSATYASKGLVGAALLGQKKYAEAEPLLESGYRGMKEREEGIPLEGRRRLDETLERLAELCEATGRADAAVAWRAELAARREAAAASLHAPKDEPDEESK